MRLLNLAQLKKMPDNTIFTAMHTEDCEGVLFKMTRNYKNIVAVPLTGIGTLDYKGQSATGQVNMEVFNEPTGSLKFSLYLNGVDEIEFHEDTIFMVYDKNDLSVLINALSVSADIEQEFIRNGDAIKAASSVIFK